MGLSRILCKRSPRVQTAETGMGRQRSDRCRLFSTITPTEPDIKGGEAGLLAAFTLDVRIRRCYSGMRSAKYAVHLHVDIHNRFPPVFIGVGLVPPVPRLFPDLRQGVSIPAPRRNSASAPAAARPRQKNVSSSCSFPPSASAFYLYRAPAGRILTHF